MAVGNIAEMGARWQAGVQGREAKFSRRFAESRDQVIAGLRAIGANPGPDFSRRVLGANSQAAASAWARKVNAPGAAERYTSNWASAIST